MNLRKDSGLTWVPLTEGQAWKKNLMVIRELQGVLKNTGLDTPELKNISLFLGKVGSQVMRKNNIFKDVKIEGLTDELGN